MHFTRTFVPDVGPTRLILYRVRNLMMAYAIERRWLESLLTELTYISAVQQDPLLIHSAPIFHTHDEVHKVYRWVAEDAMRLLEYIHAKDEWNTRCSFSEMLELTERSQRFGESTLCVTWNPTRGIAL